MPNRMQVSYDVNRAMFHVLVPTLIPEDEYNVGLRPSNLNIGREPWADQLSAIFEALRAKYAQLHAEDIRTEAVRTYDRPLADTRDHIVDEILLAGIWFPTG
jgi:predicted nucleic-acid-binding protein